MSRRSFASSVVMPLAPRLQPAKIISIFHRKCRVLPRPATRLCNRIMYHMLANPRQRLCDSSNPPRCVLCLLSPVRTSHRPGHELHTLRPSRPCPQPPSSTPALRVPILQRHCLSTGTSVRSCILEWRGIVTCRVNNRIQRLPCQRPSVETFFCLVPCQKN